MQPATDGSLCPNDPSPATEPMDAPGRPAVRSAAAWRPVDDAVAHVAARPGRDGPVAGQPDLVLWAGDVSFAQPPAGEFRLLIEEYEVISADHVLVEDDRNRQPGRLIYAETLAVDEALVGEG